MSTATLRIPPTATVRLHMRLGGPFPNIVVVASASGQPTPEDITTTPGQVSALLQHDGGVAWPDRRGAALMAAMLDQGGDVMLAFERLADALACRARLEREARR